MPFDPLPEIFVDELNRIDPSRDAVIELGCGDGAFGRLVRARGVPIMGLDLRAPTCGSRADVVGDARRAPLRAGRLRLLLAANLVRHLVPRDRTWRFLAHWAGLLRPDGALFIFEDAAGGTSAAARNFERLQAFLSTVMPEARGPLLRADDLERQARAGCGWHVAASGRQRNRSRVDGAAVVNLLRGAGQQPAGDAAALADDIRRDGIEPGAYWWYRIVGEGQEQT